MQAFDSFFTEYQIAMHRFELKEHKLLIPQNGKLFAYRKYRLCAALNLESEIQFSSRIMVFDRNGKFFLLKMDASQRHSIYMWLLFCLSFRMEFKMRPFITMREIHWKLWSAQNRVFAIGVKKLA